jgi:hypothetical protein
MASINIDNYDIDTEALRLVELLQGVLERVESVFVSHGVPLPPRRYWTVGVPAVDCEQLTVSFVDGYLGAPGDQAALPLRCNVPRSVNMSIEISRPVPVVGQNGSTPTAQVIQDASRIALVDSWVLLTAINLLDVWDTDLGAFGGPGVIATVQISGVEGGYMVTSMRVTMAVP